MTTRAGLRALIRQELNDAGGTPLWTDALLNEWITQAIRAYGRELPREIRATITAVAEQDTYTLPADLDRVVRVEQPKDAPRAPAPGSWKPSAPSYRVVAGQLILDPPPGAAGGDNDIRLEYLGRYAEPTADADVLATPPSDDDLLAKLAAASALRWISTDESKRQRFERQRGASAGEMAGLYERQARDALALRKRRVRSNHLSAT